MKFNCEFGAILMIYRKPGSQWALEQAKYNLVNNYFLVGVTEEMEDFIYLLELSLPRLAKQNNARVKFFFFFANTNSITFSILQHIQRVNESISQFQ